ncbi:hypothetical protein BV20DRAFT_978650 [Pilatotrama ljubarskyi]|nr:hypothetical protein BV20DRAFT_978650 [Pilatotrama ljubarskyi]
MSASSTSRPDRPPPEGVYIKLFCPEGGGDPSSLLRATVQPSIAETEGSAATARSKETGLRCPTPEVVPTTAPSHDSLPEVASGDNRLIPESVNFSYCEESQPNHSDEYVTEMETKGDLLAAQSQRASSNTTWVLGERFCKIVEPLPNPAAEHAQGERNHPGYVIERFQWNDIRGKSIVLNHGIDVPDVPSGYKSEITSWDGRVNYSFREDRGVVLLGRLRDRPRTFTIPHSFSWGAESSRRDRKRLDYAPAVAICTTEDLVLRPQFSGILGLGACMYQDGFRDLLQGCRDPAAEAPSFVWNLRKHLKAVPIEGGIIIYFLLRPQVLSHFTEKGPRLSSYLALQTWPCRQIPRWSPALHVNTASKLWELRLAGINIWCDVEATTASAEALWDKSPTSSVMFDIAVLLNTGASASYFSGFVQQRLRAETVCLSRTVVETLPHQLFAPYYVLRSQAQDRETTVELLFRESGRTISVYVPALGFLYNTHGEGLVWSLPGGTHGDGHGSTKGLLRVNFFQVVYAAFHIPETEDPYIRLAPQSRKEAVEGRYDVPKEEEVTDYDT